ncbi:hypothetical protein DIPPA_24378 [Diplonema papillatum]|nr:hypothetical protein DIPPA_24378 [Diplonema papillatum]
MQAVLEKAWIKGIRAANASGNHHHPGGPKHLVVGGAAGAMSASSHRTESTGGLSTISCGDADKCRGSSLFCRDGLATHSAADTPPSPEHGHATPGAGSTSLLLLQPDATPSASPALAADIYPPEPMFSSRRCSHPIAPRAGSLQLPGDAADAFAVDPVAPQDTES